MVTLLIGRVGRNLGGVETAIDEEVKKPSQKVLKNLKKKLQKDLKDRTNQE